MNQITFRVIQELVMIPTFVFVVALIALTGLTWLGSFKSELVALNWKWYIAALFVIWLIADAYNPNDGLSYAFVIIGFIPLFISIFVRKNPTRKVKK